MKFIYNRLIPFKGYNAMSIWPFVFIREEYYMTPVDARHEAIHYYQQKEMLLVLFIVWYAIEYLVRLMLYGNHRDAYRNVSFEQEAYEHQLDIDDYVSKRKHYAWVRYVVRKSYNKK